MSNISDTTNLYSIAVNAIRRHVDKTQAKLDLEAMEARTANIAQARLDVMGDVKPDDPQYPVLSLLSQTLTIGREDDNYPMWSFPESTKQVILAAVAAGVIPKSGSTLKVGNLGLYNDASGFFDHSQTHEADYSAWLKARSYRNQQTVQKL